MTRLSINVLSQFIPCRFTSFVSLLTPLACGGGNSVDEFVDEGSWCLQQKGDVALKATVVTPGCFSGSCSESVVEACDLSREGSTLTLTSLLRVKQLDNQECSADCRVYQATCSLDGVPEGSYELVHGQTRTRLQVPLGQSGASSGDNAEFCKPAPLR